MKTLIFFCSDPLIEVAPQRGYSPHSYIVARIEFMRRHRQDRMHSDENAATAIECNRSMVRGHDHW
jgi:hypothetical protein